MSRSFSQNRSARTLHFCHNMLSLTSSFVTPVARAAGPSRAHVAMMDIIEPVLGETTVSNPKPPYTCGTGT